jgi:hypothetical protein
MKRIDEHMRLRKKSTIFNSANKQNPKMNKGEKANYSNQPGK